MYDAQGWLDMAKERSVKAAWALNRLCADDQHVKSELLDAMDKLHTALEHCKDAAQKLGVDYKPLIGS